MESTCWHCGAIFNPESSGGHCPNCGYHSAAWLAKLRFAAVDFIGPIALLYIGLVQLHDDPAFSVMFVVGSLCWAGFVYFQDTEDWIEMPVEGLRRGGSGGADDSTRPSKPPMPESWSRLAEIPRPRQLESLTPPDMDDTSPRGSRKPGAPGLTWAEQLLIAGLVCGLVVYTVSRWSSIANFMLHGKISLSSFVSPAVVVCLIFYAVRRTRADEQILQNGALTTGVLTGWYDKSSYTRSGFHSYIRIRYQFWTESGQKFEGSGTLTSGNSVGSLSINQEPLKVFYLPENPSKNVALCCTTCRVRLD